MLVRICVVSLDDFEQEMTDAFEVRFVRAGTEPRGNRPGRARRDPLRGPGCSTWGEAAAEQVALDMEPYPRKPDAVLPDEATEFDASPFAALKARLTR